MHNELRYQAKIHTIFAQLLKEKKKIPHLSPPIIIIIIIILLKTQKHKNNKNMIDDNTPSMYSKIKLDLKERGLDIPRQKSNSLMCFLLSSPNSTCRSFSRQQKKTWGIK
jgi:hypothetical protein